MIYTFCGKRIISFLLYSKWLLPKRDINVISNLLSFTMNFIISIYLRYIDFPNKIVSFATGSLKLHGHMSIANSAVGNDCPTILVVQLISHLDECDVPVIISALYETQY